ncbi:MAG: sigma-E processing peptidase SpoIIGA [Oscillospiraceae bacterium]|nr:sigma-E processing peptidase SpoIIGA [Oscillospiraceae bacterium]
MRYIYIDVLLIVNLYVNWIMLRAVAKVLCDSISAKRCLAAALFGSLMSLSILLEPFPLVLSVLYKLFGALVMTLIAFGKKGVIRHTLFLFFFSFIFAGTALCLSILFPSNNTIVSNSSVYFDISFLSLFIFTSAAYLIICLVSYFFGTKAYKNGVFRVTVNTGVKSITLKGIADTGNLLVDTLSGKPVIVCSKDDFDFDIESVAGQNIKQFKGLRYLPYSTISGDAAMPVFVPTNVEIIEDNAKKTKKVEALIGLGENSGCAVFNPKILL